MDMFAPQSAVLPEQLAFEDFYVGAYPKLVAAVSVLARDSETAHDAVDEACVRAFERWKRVGRMENPSGWTYTVAVNVLRRQGRRFTLEQRTLRKELAPGPMPAPSADALALRTAIRTLPPRSRDAVILRYFFDLTESDVADRLGVTRGTVAASLHTARTTLARQLDDEVNTSGPSGLSSSSGHPISEDDHA